MARYDCTIIEYIHRRLSFSDTGCWEFHGRYQTRGYGQILYQGQQQLVHRIVYRIMKGRIPKGVFVLHSCDNPRCVNPDHLRLGTAQDNSDDMVDRNRQGNGYVRRI